MKGLKTKTLVFTAINRFDYTNLFLFYPNAKTIILKALDYLIIGQGLAGSVLSYELLKRGKKILVIDEPTHNTSSIVAAGLYNPVTGRKMVRTWRADDLFPMIGPFYSALEQDLKSRFHYAKEIYRPFVSIEEMNDWIGRSSDDKFKIYIKNVKSTSSDDKLIRDPFGGVSLNHTGYVDVPMLLSACRTYLKDQNAYAQKVLDEDQLVVKEDSVLYDGLIFKKVIFCAGAGVHRSRFFDWLPFNPVKGEILTIKHREIFNKIYNRGVFVIPVGEGLARVGATYSHEIDSILPSEKAVTYLKEKLGGLMNLDYQIVDHMVGIRPATRDRRPFAGFHPNYQSVGIFNGFGSKGVSLIPFFAIEFSDYLEKSTELSDEIDIKRYFSLLE